MVPSWTETLVRAGVQVVGRTRYCIHPVNQVADIPIVGGTKDISWGLVADLKPDLVLLDKEENPLEMAEECPVPYLATHVTSLETLQQELARLGDYFKNAQLIEQSIRCLDVISAPRAKWDMNRIPGFLDWVEKPRRATNEVTYLIWKKPWMGASRQTYIGSVLDKLGADLKEFSTADKYPVLDEADLSERLLLFSSEPFPFHKKREELQRLGLKGAIVNGEAYSWFGTRSLDFLCEALEVERGKI